MQKNHEMNRSRINPRSIIVSALAQGPLPVFAVTYESPWQAPRASLWHAVMAGLPPQRGARRWYLRTAEALLDRQLCRLKRAGRIRSEPGGRISLRGRRPCTARTNKGAHTR